MHQATPSRKLILLFAAIFSLLLLLSAAGLLTLSLVYGDKVKELVVNEINSRLLVPVEVEKIEFTVFRHFPDASVVFRNVAMKPAAGREGDPGLLHAGSVSLRIGLFSLLSGNYKIRSLVIEDAAATLYVGLDGRDNFHILKPQGSSSGSDVQFDMQQVILRKTSVYYRNLIKKTDLAFGFPDFMLRGKMADQRFDLQALGEMEIKRLILGEYNYTPKSLLGIRAVIRVDETLKRGEISDATLRFAGVTAGIRGTFGYGKESNPVNLSISSSGAGISEVLGALPPSVSAPYREYEPSGSLTFSAEIAGNWGKRASPVFRTTFNLSEGQFTHRESGSNISNIQLSGKYTSAQGRIPEMLSLDNFSGETHNGRFKGRIQLSDFGKPRINLSLSADVDLSGLKGFPGTQGAGDLYGRAVADITYRGAWESGAKMAVTANGLIRLSNAGFTGKTSGMKVKEINGQFELKNGRIYVDELKSVIGETDMSMHGFFDNLIGYLFFKDQPLHFEARVTSGNFRLEDVIHLSGPSSDNTVRPSLFPKRLTFTAGFSIGKFSYKKFTAVSATGNLTLEDNVLRANELSFNALDGKVKATGLVNGRYGSHAQVVCNARLTDVDIPRLFHEFDDFGQTSLQSRHLKGRGDAVVQYASSLSNRLETDAGSVTAIADVEIRNGELIKFEPFQELSRFLEEEELKQVKFSTMRNRIEIARKTVVIPEMEIQTSALNVKGYGSHTFGNDIDYHISVLTSELRKNKRRKAPPASAVEDDGMGRTRLFLHLTGTVDDPVFSYDHRAVARKIANDFKEEKKVFRDVIQREFGKNKPSVDPGKTKTSTQFEIEWDEDK